MLTPGSGTVTKMREMMNVEVMFSICHCCERMRCIRRFIVTLGEGLQEKLFRSALQKAHLHLHVLISLKGHLRLHILL